MLCLLLTEIRDAVALAVQIPLPVILRKRTNPFPGSPKLGVNTRHLDFFPALPRHCFPQKAEGNQQVKQTTGPQTPQASNTELIPAFPSRNSFVIKANTGSS